MIIMIRHTIIFAVFIVIFANSAAIAAKDKIIYQLKPNQSKPFSLKTTTKPIPINKAIKKPVDLYPSAKTDMQNEKVGLSVGIKAGSGAGMSGASGDVIYSLAKILPGAALRGGVGYMTGAPKTTVGNLKIATVNLDGVLDIVKKSSSNPLDIYLGGGVIYPWKVSNSQSSGLWGAHAYVGGNFSLQEYWSIYGELAYSGIKYDKTESAIKGVEATMGYRYSF